MIILLTYGLPIVKFTFVNSNDQISRNRFRSIARHQISKTAYEPKAYAPVFGAGGEPSTWLPPEELVEQSRL